MISPRQVTMTVTLTSATTSECPAGGLVIAPEALIQKGVLVPLLTPAGTRTRPEWADPSGAVQRAGAHVV